MALVNIELYSNPENLAPVALSAKYLSVQPSCGGPIPQELSGPATCIAPDVLPPLIAHRQTRQVKCTKQVFLNNVSFDNLFNFISLP